MDRKGRGTGPFFPEGKEREYGTDHPAVSYTHLLLDVLEGWQKKGGTLYCLIGGQTFSSGAMDAGYLRDMGAVMVGESTGGLEGGFGELGQETLPNGCTLYYSTKDFGSRGPVEPDVEAAQTVEDLLAGRDTVLAAALALEPDKAN